jgi:hypothetical protein
MSEASFWLFVLACAVLFAGEPDLHDAIVAWASAKVCAP